MRARSHAGVGGLPRRVLQTRAWKLKGLAGRWEGHVVTPDGPEGAIECRVTAAGKLVMEVLFPDSEHEMVSLYFGRRRRITFGERSRG